MATPEDDYTKYDVHSRDEILAILRGMMEQGSLITFYFNHGYDFLLTSLLEVSADGKSLIFDYGSNMEMNQKLLQADKIKCVSSKEKVKIQFTLLGVDPLRHEGRPAFLGDVPDVLTRLQRREHYRLSTPMAHPIKASVPVPQNDGSIKTLQLVVAHISGGGVGLNVPKEELSVKTDAEFSGVTIDLPNVGTIVVNIRVRNLYDVTLANGKTQQCAGCQFIDLPGPMMTLIQRYILQVERERKAREV